MREQSIQTQIKTKLKAAGWLVRKVIQCGDAGWPDLEAFRSGECVHIEVKRPGEKPTTLQEFRHKQLRDQGFEVIVADNVKAVAHLFFVRPVNKS